MPTPIKTGIIGYGLSAKIFHIPFVQFLSSDFALHSIVQRRPTEASSAPADHPDVKHYTSAEAMLADREVELVIISSIPDTHFSFCKQSLLAGKHVLCEKPLVPTSAEALELGRIAREHKRVLAAYQNRRWDADFLTLRELLERDALGRVVDFESHFDRHRPDPPATASWKAEALPASGAIYDLGTHLLDQFVALFGLPERVTAFVGNQRVYDESGAGGDAGGDSFTVHLHYDARGLLATARAGVVSPEVQQLRYWVRGTKGSFRKYGLDVQEDQLKAGKRPGQDADFGSEYHGMNGVLTTIDKDTGKPAMEKIKPKDPPATYSAFYSQLARAIRGDGDPPVDADEAAKVLKVIELAKLSSTSGKTLPVEFP